MRAGVASVIVVAALIIGWSVAATDQPPHQLELVPPEPSFGVKDRVAVAPPGLVLPYEAGRPSLRGLAEEAGIIIGAAVEPEDMSWEPLYNPLIAREFNVVATENVLKFRLVRKTEYRYVFGPADMIVDFAAQNDMQVRGVTLVWHEELPDWLTVKDLNRDEVVAALKEHIDTVVGRYKGRIQYWDVVNEAVDWDGSMRKTYWSEKIGPDYIDLAFELAHAADPDAKLFYNDFNAEDLGDKSDGVYELVKGMVERGVPIDGVGFQGHFDIDEAPNPDEVAANIERIAALGLEVQFTEFDVRIAEPVTDEKLEAQSGIYWSMMNVCVENPACTGFLTWGVTDKFSWIDHFLEGYTAGLMFDEFYQPKPAYWALRDALEQRLGIGSYAPD